MFLGLCSSEREASMIGRSSVITFNVTLIFTIIACTKCDDSPITKMDSKDFIGDKAHAGFTAAFGDINSDKQTDVYVISGDKHHILIFLGSVIPPALNLHQTLNVTFEATSVAPGDFDGDDISDLLVTGMKDSSYSVYIYWGNENGGIKKDGFYTLPDSLKDEPLVLDCNGDMISDLFVVYPNNSRGFLVGQTGKNGWSFRSKDFVTKDKILNLYTPNSNAFIDLTGDGSADLFVSALDEGNKMVYEVWKGTPSGLVLANQMKTADNEFFPYPTLKISPVSFADFDADGKQDVLVAVCKPEGESCKEGKILLFANDNWYAIFSTTEDWVFPDKPGEVSHELNTLHIADFNLDSYPDVLTILQDKDGVRKTVILYNDVCNSGMCLDAGRQLRVALVMPESDNAVLAAFYDFNMDGTLDVIVTTKLDEKYEMMAYSNMIADDVTFLRVQVLSGHSDKVLYGVNVQGPQIAYETTNPTGGAQYGSLGQLSKTAHLSLQLPYVIFGLGRLANFVDKLTVCVPVPLIIDLADGVQANEIPPDTPRHNSTFSPLNNTWTMLIPNSQLYVIPYPRSTPSSWKNKLLVTPSRNVVTTAIVLLGTCGVLVIATLVLHLMERREDKQEKIQEAYRFHFDAM